jgi:hypothetical protein
MTALSPRGRFRVQALAAGLTFVLGMLTALVPDWIEEIFGVDPDGGNGSTEVLLVAACLVATVAFAVLATRSYRRLTS